MDSYIPIPERAIDKPFLMPIEDIFSIQGRGTVVTGRIERGICKVGEEMEIVGFRDTRKTVVTGVEMFKKLLDEGRAGDNVGLLLRGVEKEEVERGQVISKPGSITPHKKFKGEVYVLSKEEGGSARAAAPWARERSRRLWSRKRHGPRLAKINLWRAKSSPCSAPNARIGIIRTPRIRKPRQNGWN